MAIFSLKGNAIFIVIGIVVIVIGFVVTVAIIVIVMVVIVIFAALPIPLRWQEMKNASFDNRIQSDKLANSLEAHSVQRVSLMFYPLLVKSLKTYLNKQFSNK